MEDLISESESDADFHQASELEDEKGECEECGTVEGDDMVQLQHDHRDEQKVKTHACLRSA